jgi:hypothetical protein
MDLIFMIFPISSIVLARAVTRRGCFEDSIRLPFWYGVSIWVVCALFLAATGYDVYQLNDQTATTAFLALCWLLGNGYIITNSFCSPYANAVFSILLLAVCIALYQRLQSFGKLLGRDCILPTIAFSIFLCVLSVTHFPALKSK